MISHVVARKISIIGQIANRGQQFPTRGGKAGWFTSGTKERHGSGAALHAFELAIGPAVNEHEIFFAGHKSWRETAELVFRAELATAMCHPEHGRQLAFK